MGTHNYQLNVLFKIPPNNHKVYNLGCGSPVRLSKFINFKLEYNSSIQEVEKKLNKLIRYSDPDPDRETLFIWPEGIFTGFNYNQILQFSNLIEDNFNANHLIL